MKRSDLGVMLESTTVEILFQVETAQAGMSAKYIYNSRNSISSWNPEVVRGLPGIYNSRNSISSWNRSEASASSPIYNSRNSISSWNMVRANEIKESTTVEILFQVETLQGFLPCWKSTTVEILFQVET